MYSPKPAPFKFADPALKYRIDLNMFELLEDYVSPEITIPKSFLTDGATVPRIFWCLIPPYHRYLPAAIIHDYQCDLGVDRHFALKLFRTNLLRLGISAKYRFVMYYGIKAYIYWLAFKEEVRKWL